jgi:hypothetical protein
MIRRLLLSSALALALLLSGCDEDPILNTERDTLSDPIADIAALGGYLFTTNEDWSGHAGSQVDLFKFSVDGFPEGRFDLGLNGVGYLAATADHAAIYLQARDTGLLFKVTPVGEIAWTRGDPYADSRHLACGLAYRADLDSFVTLYHEPGTANYTARHHGPDFAGASDPLPARTFDSFDPDTGIRAIAWHNGWLWALGRNPAGEAVVQGFADDGGVTRYLTLPDSTACGLAPTDDGLRVAYPDRRFELLSLDVRQVGRAPLLEDAAAAKSAQGAQYRQGPRSPS